MISVDTSSGKRVASIETKHGTLTGPLFMPDATYGTVHEVSMQDLNEINIPALVTTTLHIEQKLGAEYLGKYGGAHKLFGWDKPLLTDSGGFQVFSLIHRNKHPKNLITEAGCSFIDFKDGSYNFLSPERSQYVQHLIGSDIRVVLDEPVIEDDSISTIKASVDRTTRWAKRSKQAFLQLHGLTDKDFNNPSIKRPLLTAVVQGANNFEWRKRSADALIEIGFDIYGFGGLPLHNKHSWKEDAKQGFYHDLISYVAELLPEDKLRYGLGMGTPDDLIYAYNAGWDIFDSVLPTRNARHGYIYVSKGQGDKSYEHYDVLHIKSKRYEFDEGVIDETLEDVPYPQVSRAYLRHLMRIKSGTGMRIATMHNLHFYQKLMESL